MQSRSGWASTSGRAGAHEPGSSRGRWPRAQAPGRQAPSRACAVLAPARLPDSQAQGGWDALRAARVITAIKTPYLECGKMDLRAYDRLVEHQIAAGVDGLIIGGTTGEGQLMSWDEHIMCAPAVAARPPGPAAGRLRPDGRARLRQADRAHRQPLWPGPACHWQHGQQRDARGRARDGAGLCGGHARGAADQPVLRQDLAPRPAQPLSRGAGRGARHPVQRARAHGPGHTRRRRARPGLARQLPGHQGVHRQPAHRGARAPPQALQPTRALPARPRAGPDRPLCAPGVCRPRHPVLDRQRRRGARRAALARRPGRHLGDLKHHPEPLRAAHAAAERRAG